MRKLRPTIQPSGDERHPPDRYLSLRMFAESSAPERQQHAVPSTGQVEHSLRHHEAHAEEQVTCGKKWDDEESQAQRKDPGKRELRKWLFVAVSRKCATQH